MSCIPHLQSIKVRDEWATPIKWIRYMMYNFDVTPSIDVCCTEKNAQFAKYFTKEQDGLKQQWDKPFFMNPPYSQISNWLRYAYSQHRTHNVTGVALIYSKTDTRYWHDYVEGKAEVHFIKGRIKFLDHNMQESKNAAPYPSCFVIWRSKK